MTAEERIEALELELKLLREQPKALGYYREARQRCRDHYNSVNEKGHGYTGLMSCEDITREVMRNKYMEKGKKTPARYIDTPEKAEEYVNLFREFLRVYQAHAKREEL